MSDVPVRKTSRRKTYLLIGIAGLAVSAVAAFAAELLADRTAIVLSLVVGATSSIGILWGEYQFDRLSDSNENRLNELVKSTDRQFEKLGQSIEIDRKLRSYLPLLTLRLDLEEEARGLGGPAAEDIRQGVDIVFDHATEELDRIKTKGPQRKNDDVSDIKREIESLGGKCILKGVHLCTEFESLRLYNSDRWQDYLKSNFDVIRCGGIVQRVFVFSRKELQAHPPDSQNAEDVLAWNALLEQWRGKINVGIAVADMVNQEDRQIEASCEYAILSRLDRDQTPIFAQSHEFRAGAVTGGNVNPYGPARRIPYAGNYQRRVEVFVSDFDVLWQKSVHLDSALGVCSVDVDFEDQRGKLASVLKQRRLLQGA